MKDQVVKVLESYFITHDVKRFAVEKPKGFEFTPGQATNVAVNLPEWKHQFRPFTFTGLNKWDYLEFIVKIYRDHDGVTKKLGGINAGDELIMHDLFGAIEYKGPGVFMAGGSGITPFLAIFRELHRNKGLGGNRLIYSNKTADDVIMGAELQEMLKENYTNVFTRARIGFLDNHIDRDFLIENIVDFSQYFYVCGPEMFVKNISDNLVELGAELESLVIEK